MIWRSTQSSATPMVPTALQISIAPRLTYTAGQSRPLRGACSAGATPNESLRLTVTTLALAIGSICALGFFFTLVGQQQRPPRRAPISVIAGVFASLGAFGLTFLTLYVISWVLGI